jgi:radical SAM-linked protein
LGGVSALSSIRIKFVRGEEVKYISHLDMMKAFERAIRRSGLPISYSKGFNPHPQMVFGLPLSVGVTSDAEYADFELEEDIDAEQFMNVLNSQLPKGLKIVDSKEKKTKKNVMSEISRASYRVIILCKSKIGINEINCKISEFLKKQEIIIKKKTKNRIRDTDIRQMIFRMEAYSIDGICESYKGTDFIFELRATLSAGSKGNLKPELLIKAFSKAIDHEFTPVKIHRTELFVDTGDKVSDPLAV